MVLDAVSAPRSYSQNSGGQSETAGAKKNADYDTFIKLLVAQMKNQDPTKPMDSTEFVAQLASFSSVEQSIKMNETLAQMLSNGSINGAEGYVGKYIQFTDEKDKVIGGYVVSIDIYGDGIVATLDNDEKVVIGPGVKVMVEKPDVEGYKPDENADNSDTDRHKSYVGGF
ncbi:MULTISPECIES: flagellar hook assembly protein FlgD [unclassified Bartonella]|uniref:flagellar hook assembly protein FlgD n=1 Tax=unclassified Bartonella TaxID=2645622 RepID=UPI0009998A18|nr:MULTISPECIES: flagellar hook assembly protein FlgD [unclassified Bartonella]AQX27753.1 flagellar basal-body rod modification protein FlgD [Bartonella sp. JB15]AQX29035.1 flagellar basal-body rod modification protein FlgD [Bartonella sp. JB63]